MDDNKPVVFLRADGSSDIGLGHVYRCLAVAERIKDVFSIFFLIQDPSNALKSLINEHAVVIELPATCNYVHESFDICAIISKYSAKIILLDGYFFDNEYQKALMKSDVKIISIDDCQPFHYVSDVVINHADGLSESRILSESYTKIYLGSDYALLRKAFVDIQGRGRKLEHLHNVMVCFGGADSGNITMKVLSSLLELNLFENINVITGSAYQYSGSLEHVCGKNKQVHCHSNLSPDQMINLMQQNELAIVPASTIAMECMMAKMILLTGTTADNQKCLYNSLINKVQAYSIGDFNVIGKAELKDKIIHITNTFNGHVFPPVFSASDPVINVFQSLI